MGDLTSLALAYLDAGFSILPIGRDKRPEGIASWNPFRDNPPTEDQVRSWFTNPRVYGLALVCGKVSCLEVLDFDDVGAYHAWRAMVDEDGILPPDLPVITTPKGGAHVLLKVSVPMPSEKLAMRPGPRRAGQVLIETKGEGGYIVAAGSGQQCHPDGGQWLHVEGSRLESWRTVKYVTEDVYHTLVAYAVSCNEDPHLRLRRWEEMTQRGPASRVGGGVRVGDDYEARADWPSILEPHGWVRVASHGAVIKWRRPGKHRGGCSATTGFCTSGGKDRLHVFSSNAEPFELDRTYGKFAAYAILNHGGLEPANFADAARALVKDGYGDDGSAADPRAIEAKLSDVAHALKADGSDPAMLKKVQEARAKNQEKIANLPASDGSRDGNLLELRALLGIAVSRVVKLGRGAQPSYKLELDDSTVLRFPTIEELTTSRKFEMEMMRRVEKQLDPTHATGKRWRHVRGLILALIDPEDAEHRDVDDTLEWVEDYLRGTALYGEGDQSWSYGLADGSPFVRDGHIWIYKADLLRTLTIRGVRLTSSQLDDRLRDAGMKRKKVSGTCGNGSRVHRWYWQMDPHLSVSTLDALRVPQGEKNGNG